MNIKTDYTREQLIDICERAIVPQDKWSDRDSASAHEKVGISYVYLKAGVEFDIVDEDEILQPDEFTIWIKFKVKGFNYTEMGEYDVATCYIPSEKALDKAKGEDWYGIE